MRAIAVQHQQGNDLMFKTHSKSGAARTPNKKRAPTGKRRTLEQKRSSKCHWFIACRQLPPGSRHTKIDGNP